MSSSTWTAQHIPAQHGRVAIVTGANTGLGFETAAALAAKGAHVVLAVRNLDKGNAAAERISSAVVFGVALLFLGDTFLAWQRACVAVPRTLFTQGSICVRANAWHGTAAGMGAIAGIAAILLLTWEGARLAGADLNVGVERRLVTTILAGAVVVAAALKWALVLGNYAGPGAWLGLLLAAALGGWVVMQRRTG